MFSLTLPKYLNVFLYFFLIEGIQGRHVTTHGLSLNCNNDLTWFNHITPCGLEGKGVTSVSTVLDRNVSVQEVLPALLKSFSEVFDADFLNESEL